MIAMAVRALRLRGTDDTAAVIVTARGQPLPVERSDSRIASASAAHPHTDPDHDFLR
jgi:hypothetical protein